MTGTSDPRHPSQDLWVAEHAVRRRILLDVYGPAWRDNADVMREHAQYGFHFDYDAARLRGCFRLQDADRAELIALVDQGEALLYPDGLVVEDLLLFGGEFAAPFRPPRRAVTIRVETLEQFEDLVAGRPELDGHIRVYRGQTSEYLSAVWKNHVSLEPGAARRAAWPGETLTHWDVEAAFADTTARHGTYAEQAMAAQAQLLRRRLESPQDIWAVLARSAAPFLAGPHLDAWILDAILQHYGPATNSLDVTKDPFTALFFATHRFVRIDDKRVTYERSASHGVVYEMALPVEAEAHQPGPPFATPWLDLDALFADIPDLRPKRQQGLLLRPHPIGAVDGVADGVRCATHVAKRLVVSPAILDELAEARRPLDQSAFFPPPDIDPLYKAVADHPLIPLYC